MFQLVNVCTVAESGSATLFKRETKTLYKNTFSKCYTSMHCVQMQVLQSLKLNNHPYYVNIGALTQREGWDDIHHPPLFHTVQKLTQWEMGSHLKCVPIAHVLTVHCLKWLKFHFSELENSRLFAESLVPIGWIIFLGL